MVATQVSWQLIQFSYNLLVNLRRSSTSSVTTLDSYNYDIHNDNDDRVQHHDKNRYLIRYPDITFNI